MVRTRTSQNYNSFQILSSRKLEADLRSNGLKESNKKKKKTCICLEPFPPAGLSLPHAQELGGWQTPKTADHREAPWASKERGKIRKEKDSIYLSHIIIHNKVIAANLCINPYL